MDNMISAAESDAALFGLLKTWGDKLLSLQTSEGVFFCPACSRVHGRCHESVYPLLYLAERTGEKKYLDSSKKLFEWSSALVQPDGSVLNDTFSEWKGVTVFAAVALHDALYFHGTLLSSSERAIWEQRLAGMGEWIYKNLFPGAKAYINYYAAAGCALALLGNYFKNNEYLSAARALADTCLRHVSDGLIYGECSPSDARSPKGCYGIDHGYNAEETLPSLCRCAEALKDGALLRSCAALYKEQLFFMLPDGAWDDSAGTRSFKWTYWGSRTSDGCQDALFKLGRSDPVFAEAAYRNLMLLKRCTHDGLLAGGPDYAKLNEKICFHHTFCHAKVLAGALDAGVDGFLRTSLPSDDPQTRYYPQTDTYRLANGAFSADITGYDAIYKKGGHISGGTPSLLYHRKNGPLIAAGMTKYSLFEPHNQQLPVTPEKHRCPCPRLESEDGSYSQLFDFGAVLFLSRDTTEPSVRVNAVLRDEDGAPMTKGNIVITYVLENDGLMMDCQTETSARIRLVLPIIPPGSVFVSHGALVRPPESAYSLTPGFAFNEYVISPDKNGSIIVKIFAIND